MRKYIQYLGNSNIAIGLEGEEQEIIIEGNFAYNHKATKEEVIWVGPHFAYYLTTETRLNNYLKNRCMVELQGTHAARRVIENGRRVSLIPRLAEQKAKEKLNEYIEQRFIYLEKTVEEEEISLDLAA